MGHATDFGRCGSRVLDAAGCRFPRRAEIVPADLLFFRHMCAFLFDSKLPRRAAKSWYRRLEVGSGNHFNVRQALELAGGEVYLSRL